MIVIPNPINHMTAVQAVSEDFINRATEIESTCKYNDQSDFQGAGIIYIYKYEGKKKIDISHFSTNGRLREIEQLAQKICLQHEGLYFNTWLN